MKIQNTIRRWARREEVALGYQLHGKTANDRFRGLRRSELNEAKLFLLAMAPAVVTGPFIGKWSDTSLLGKSIVAVTCLWMIGVFIGGAFLLFRAIFRASRKRSD